MTLMSHNPSYDLKSKKGQKPANQPLLEPDREKQTAPLADDELNKEHATTDEGAGTGLGKGRPAGQYQRHDNNITNFDIYDRPGSRTSGVLPDVNAYQQKKNLAEGMMDLALFTANTNQLRYVIEASSSHPYYYFSLTSIIFSLFLQMAVGVGLVLNSRYDIKYKKDICIADKINNMTVLGIFLVTIMNVFIAAFSVAPTNTAIPVAVPALPAPIQ